MKIKLFILFYVLNNFCVLGQTNILVGDFYYNFSGDEAWISNKGKETYESWYNGWYTKSTCYIPEYVVYNGANYKVTKIDSRAFEYCTSISKVSIPNTVTTINRNAFKGCTGLQEIIIPSGVTTFPGSGINDSYYAPFYECNFLRTIIYTRKTAPANWTATTRTYVPDKVSYSHPSYSMNQANVLEMITFNTNTFVYTGQSPTTTWTNNVDGYTASLTMPTLEKNVGSYVVYIPVTFTKGSESFSTEVAYRYTINGVELTAKVDDVSRIYGDNNPAFNITYSGFVNGETESVIINEPTVSTTATSISDVGEYPITISGGNAKNYTLVYEPGTLTITKAPLTAKVNDETRQYGQGNPAFTISYTGLKNGETVPKWEELLKIETTATKNSDVGNYDIMATGVPTNYSLPAIDKGILSITQAPLTIKANNATRKYFEADPSFTYTCTGFVNGDNVDVLTKEPLFATDATQTSNVGKYRITPSAAEAKNYKMSYEQGELTITKRQLNATSKCNRFYGEENPVLPIEYDGFVNSETEEVLSIKPVGTTTATKTSSVGSYPITISGGEATNYDFVYEQGVLTVTKAPLSAKVNDATKVYGTQNPSFSIEYYGLKNEEKVPTWTTAPTFQTEATETSSTGEYAVKAINGVPTNYELSMSDGTLKITPASLTIKANNATRKYFESEPSFTYTCTGFVNGDNVDVITKEPFFTTDATQTSNAGKYKISPSAAEAKNYTMSYEQGELTITKRQLQATSHSSRLYGDENPVLPIELSGFVNGETEDVISTMPVATTTAKKTSPVGSYSISISGGEATNYEFEYEPGELTVTKAPLSAKVNDATKVYGAQNPSFTIEYYGLKNGETVPAWTTAPTFQTEATKASNVGQYDVKAIGGIPRNYELGEITKGMLSITPASLTIKANNATRQYYSDEPNFSYTCTGFVNGDDKTSLSPAPTLSTTATRASNVGTYEIKVADAANPNYSISYTYGTLTITPRTLAASVGNYERLYNEDNPAFEVKYDGFVEGEDEGVLTSKATARTSAVKTSDVGTYPINVSGGSADNYTFSYTSGTLSINKAEQTISWEQDLSELEVGDQIELKGVASSGLPITYTMDNENAAEIYTIGSKSYLDCKAGGQFIIRAVQNGNKNYYSSPRVTNKVTIVGKNPDSDPMLTIQQADNGSVGVRVSKGCIYTFSIAPSAGWKIHSVTFNNTNVTNQLSSEGEYTTPAITSNSTLSVVYEEEGGSNIKSAKLSNVKVQATSSGIKVIDADMDEMIWVYTTDGKLQYSTKVESQQVDITLDKNNVYIVKVGSKTFKLGL